MTITIQAPEQALEDLALVISRFSVMDGQRRVAAVRALLETNPLLDIRQMRKARTLLGRLIRISDDPELTETAEGVSELLRERQRTAEWQQQRTDAAEVTTRLRDRALEVLKEGPLRPSALAERLGVTDPEVVRALRPLRAAGLVAVREVGPPGELGDGRARWYWYVPPEAKNVGFDEVPELLSGLKQPELFVEGDGQRFRLPVEYLDRIVTG